MGQVIPFPRAWLPPPVLAPDDEAYSAMVARAETAARRLAGGEAVWTRPISELRWLAADEDQCFGAHARRLAGDLARIEQVLAHGSVRSSSVGARVRATRKRLEERLDGEDVRQDGRR